MGEMNPLVQFHMSIDVFFLEKYFDFENRNGETLLHVLEKVIAWILFFLREFYLI